MDDSSVRAMNEMKAYLMFLGLDKHVLEFEYNRITFKQLDRLQESDWIKMNVQDYEKDIICNSLQAWKLHKNKKARRVSKGPGSGIANFLRKTLSRDVPNFEEMNEIEYTFKIVIIGPPSTGKTSLVKRYTHNDFEPYRSTIGVDWESKSIQWNSSTTISLMLYDCSGQDRFLDVVPQYYRNACAALVVFDVTNLKTLETAISWRQSLEKYKNSFIHPNIPVVLIGNKVD